MTTSFNFAASVYAQPRQEGDVDLVALIRHDLAKYFTPEMIVEIYDSHPLIISSATANPTVQRTNLSRFWTQQLFGIPNSQTARMQMIPSGEITLWYKLFSEQVLPFCVTSGAFRKVH